MSIEKRAVSGGLTGAANFGVTLLQSMVSVPLLLHYWGQEMYGAWLALSAAVALLSALDLGHQNYVGNEFNRDVAEGRQDRLRLNLASGVRMAWLLGCAQFLIAVGLVLTGWTGRFLGLSESVVREHRIDLALLVLVGNWAVLGPVGGLLTRLYAPHGLFARAQLIGIAQRLALFAVLAGVAICKGGLWAYSLVFTCYGIVFACVWFPEIRRKFPGVYPWWQGGDWRVGWKNLRASFVLTFNGVLAQFSSNGLNLLIAARLAAAAVPGFSTVRTLANTAYQASLVLIQPLVPDLVRFHVRGEWAKLSGALQAAWLAGGLVINVGLLLAAPLMPWFFNLWTQGRLDLNPHLLGLLLWSVAVRNAYAPVSAYLVGLNDLRSQVTANIAQGVVTFGLPWFFTGKLGIAAFGWGVAVGECAALIAYMHGLSRHDGLWARGFPQLFAGRALLPAFLVGGALGVGLWWPAMSVWVCPIAALCLAGLYASHWRLLSVELRNRMLRALPVLGRRFA